MNIKKRCDCSQNELEVLERHYWFSEEQAESMVKVRKNRGEKCFNTYADIDGIKTRVSWCTKKPFHETAWDDIVYLGVGIPHSIEGIKYENAKRILMDEMYHSEKQADQFIETVVDAFKEIDDAPPVKNDGSKFGNPKFGC